MPAAVGTRVGGLGAPPGLDAAPLHPLAALLVERPTHEAVDVICQVARQLSEVREALLTKWYAEDLGAAVRDHLEGVGTDLDLTSSQASTAESSGAGVAATIPGPLELCLESLCAEEPSSSSPEEVRRRTLLIAYFPRSAQEDDIARAFAGTAALARGRIARDTAGASRCFGFFEFGDEDAAEVALTACREGRIVLDDEFKHTWHLRASRSRRATAKEPLGVEPGGGAQRRRRGVRGGKAQHGKAPATVASAA